MKNAACTAGGLLLSERGVTSASRHNAETRDRHLEELLCTISYDTKFMSFNINAIQSRILPMAVAVADQTLLRVCARCRTLPLPLVDVELSPASKRRNMRKPDLLGDENQATFAPRLTKELP